MLVIHVRVLDFFFVQITQLNFSFKVNEEPMSFSEAVAEPLLATWAFHKSGSPDKLQCIVIFDKNCLWWNEMYRLVANSSLMNMVYMQQAT